MEKKQKHSADSKLIYSDYEDYVEDNMYGTRDEYDKYEDYAAKVADNGLTFSNADPEEYLERALRYSEDKDAVLKKPADPNALVFEYNVEKKRSDDDDEDDEYDDDYDVPPPRRAEPEIVEEREYEEPVGDHVTRLDVPVGVLQVINLLKAHTYTSYLVGDCVNMLVLGERVMDYDIACNASLDRIRAICEDRFKIREDLLSRGELIIINGGMGISVAPYRSRIDGSGKPIYCKTVDEDLHRRTFTSETVAYNPDSGIYDKFGGLACITAEKTILRAIDEEKFEAMELEQASMKKKPKDAPQKIVIEAIRENPECILIAMQKFARGEAEISPYTLRNINENAELIDMMLPTEISRYFRRIILGRRIGEAIMDFREVIFHIFPVLRAQLDFEQKSDYQEYTLFEHTAKAVGYGFPDYAVRLALLLHGIGKPDCAADRGEYMTYYGHSERGVMLARDAFDEYDADDSVVDRVLFMIAHHDDHISPENITDFISAFGTENTRLLLLFQSANVRAKSSDPLNDRVSASLRQLADNIGSYAPPRPRAAQGLRGRFPR